MTFPKMLPPLIGLALGLVLPASAQAKDLAVYPSADAKKHVGETAGITGAVADVHQTSKGDLLLNFGPPYPHQDFTAVIFSSDVPKFGDVGALEGKTVTVTGKITLYRDKTEIILKQPDQLKVN